MTPYDTGENPHLGKSCQQILLDLYHLTRPAKPEEKHKGYVRQYLKEMKQLYLAAEDAFKREGIPFTPKYKAKDEEAIKAKLEKARERAKKNREKKALKITKLNETI